MKIPTELAPPTHKIVKQTIMGGNCLVNERLIIKCANYNLAEKLCKHYQSHGGIDMGDYRETYVVEEI